MPAMQTEELWPAERQKWWYEVAQGNINTDAILCRSWLGLINLYLCLVSG